MAEGKECVSGTLSGLSNLLSTMCLYPGEALIQHHHNMFPFLNLEV